MFSDEQTLVDNFLDCLSSNVSPWGEIEYETEFNYLRGKTDIVVVSDDGKIIAIEAKLNKWKEALQQAYRNQCFADLSYVLLPEKVAMNAMRYDIEFKRRGVGICYFDDGKIEIIRNADESLPLQPWLHAKAKEYVVKGGNDD